MRKACDYYSDEIMKRIIQSDSDILTPYVWEGQYRTLLRILIQHELRLDLIPGLRRQDTFLSMRIAVLCAAIDISPQMIGCNVDELSAAIHNYAINVYGVPSDLNQLLFLCNSLARMILRLDNEHWAKITGPKWIREDNFENHSGQALVVHEYFKKICINKDYQIIYGYL